MSKENFITIQKVLTSISDQQVKFPNMPVGEAVQEAENLFAWCQNDKTELTRAGLDWAMVEDLPIRAGACRYAQSIWARESQIKEEAQQEWKAKSPEAFDLRDELLHHFSFAFRNQPELMKKVQVIREGGSNADMLQDLSDLSVLGKENTVPLKAIGMDLKMLDKAAETADELSDVLGRANGGAAGDDQVRENRNKAYTYMKQAVDEIRATGQYVFYKNDDRKKGYISQYLKRIRDRNKSSKSDQKLMQE